MLDEDHRNFLAGEVGGAWVFERYFSRPPCDPALNPGCVQPTPDNDYFAVAFSRSPATTCPTARISMAASTTCRQSTTSPATICCAARAGLTLPLIDPIAAKFTVLDEYDSTVAAGTDHNSLWVTVGLSLLW